MTLGQRIQELRKGCDLSQEALGEKLGVSRQAVSRWEMDGAVPEVDKLIAMSRIFGISLNDLLQVEGPEELPGAEPEPGPAEGEPAPADQGPGGIKKGRLLPALALLALLLGISALVISLGLSDRLTRLEQRISQLEAASPALDPERPLVADFQFDHQVDETSRVRYTFLLTAAQQAEGMEVELQVVDGEGAVHPVALSCQEDGTIYTGELELPFLTGRSFAASAVFRAGGMAYTRPLLDVTVSRSGWSGEVLWTEKP